MGSLFSKGSSTIHSFADVKFDVNRSVYLAGETLQGYVLADVLKETRVADFRVVLTAEFCDNFGVSGVSTVGRISKECYRSPNGTVAPGKGYEDYVILGFDSFLRDTIGSFQIPFRLEIPEEWDPSFECKPWDTGASPSSCVALHYRLEVFARTQSWFPKDYQLCKKEIRIASSVEISTLNTISTLFDLNRSGFLGAFTVTGDMTCHAELLQTAYSPGSTCRMRLQMDNRSTLPVRFRKVKLLQKRYIARQGVTHRSDKDWALPVSCVVLVRSDKDEVKGPPLAKGESSPGGKVEKQGLSDKVRQEFGAPKATTQLTLDVVLPLDTGLQSVDFNFRHSLFVKVVYVLEIKLMPASMVSSPLRFEVPITLTLPTKQDQPILALAVPEATVVETETSHVSAQIVRH